MIRMGRSSKPEENDAPQESNAPASTGYSYERDYGTSKALSESEAMARDIKDGRLNGFVGHGTVLTGETYFNSMLRVDGQLTGKVMSEDGTLIVGSTGQVDADVSVAGAVINGTVNGDVIASEKVELGRTAKVIGNIQAPRLIVEDGAILEGSCSMIKPNQQIEEIRAAEEEERAAISESQYEIRAESTETEEITGYDSASYEENDEYGYEEEDEDEESAEAAVT